MHHRGLSISNRKAALPRRAAGDADVGIYRLRTRGKTSLF